MPEITNAGLIAEARRLASSASPAPWTAIAEGRVEHSPSKPPLWCVLGTEGLGDGECSYFNEADARFVAWAREGVLQMADALERAKRERDVLEAKAKVLEAGIARTEELVTRLIVERDEAVAELEQAYNGTALGDALLDYQEAVAREAVLRESLDWALLHVGYPQRGSYESTHEITLPTKEWLSRLADAQTSLASPSPAAERLLEDAKLGRHVREAGQRGLDDVAAGRLTTQEELDMAYSAAERERDEALVREAALREAATRFITAVDNMTLSDFQTQKGLDELGVLRDALASPSPAAERLQDTKTASIDTSNLGEVVGRYKLIPQGEHERLLAQAKAADGLAAAVTVWLEEWGPKPSISFEAGNALRAYRKAKEG